MQELTLLPWSIGAHRGHRVQLVAAVVGGKGIYGKRPDGQESISSMSQPHANAAFAMSLVPTIAVEWVDVALSKEVTMIGVGAPCPSWGLRAWLPPTSTTIPLRTRGRL